MTPFIGVRISWLIVARNSDFSREASIACVPRLGQLLARCRSRSATRPAGRRSGRSVKASSRPAASRRRAARRPPRPSRPAAPASPPGCGSRRGRRAGATSTSWRAAGPLGQRRVRRRQPRRGRRTPVGTRPRVPSGPGVDADRGPGGVDAAARARRQQRLAQAGGLFAAMPSAGAGQAGGWPPPPARPRALELGDVLDGAARPHRGAVRAPARRGRGPRTQRTRPVAAHHPRVVAERRSPSARAASTAAPPARGRRGGSAPGTRPTSTVVGAAAPARRSGRAGRTRRRSSVATSHSQLPIRAIRCAVASCCSRSCEGLEQGLALGVLVTRCSQPVRRPPASSGPRGS